MLTLLIQSGELGSSDTGHRLAVAHSLWTGEPQVSPNEYPEFGIHGRHGQLYAWYGIGQSLLLLPADLAGTAASHLPVWRSYTQRRADPSIRILVVSFTTNILLNVLTALVAVRFLRTLEFSEGESVAGTLALLCATTHLHYSQNLMENNSIFLFTLTGITLQYRWLRTGDRRALFFGAAALGFNLLTRLTTVLDVLAVALFLALAALTANSRRPGGSCRGSQQSRRRTDLVRTFLWTTLPVYATFLFLDRFYQFVRFGSWTDTYIGIQAREQRSLDPTLPATYPFSGHWFLGGIHSGILGPLFSPEKSIFLFDPLLPLALLLTALLWKRLPPSVRAFAAATLALLLAYLLLYGRYFSWAGDFAWGDRYLASAVQMVALLAVPLLLRYRHALGPTRVVCGLAVVVASAIVQLASLAFWMPLEIYQIEDLGHDASTILLRFQNIAAFALGRIRRGRVDLPGGVDDTWDAAHLGTWNLLPSLLRHIGAAPPWAIHLVYGIWILIAAALAFVLSGLLRVVAHDLGKSEGLSEPQR